MTTTVAFSSRVILSYSAAVKVVGCVTEMITCNNVSSRKCTYVHEKSYNDTLHLSHSTVVLCI